MGQPYECENELGCVQAVGSAIDSIILSQPQNSIYLNWDPSRSCHAAISTVHENPARAALAYRVSTSEDDGRSPEGRKTDHIESGSELLASHVRNRRYDS